MFYNLHCSYLCRRFRSRAERTPVQPLYDQPVIKPSQRFAETRFLVVDCEMSGLDVKNSQLLSVGWVVIERGRIVNASARHLLVHADRGAGSSSRIHGLMDSSLAGAKSIAAVLMLLIQQMQGAVLVFHHAPLDIRFLQKASIENYRCPLLFSFVDTMNIEKRRMQLQGKTAGLRLPQCRARYGLDASSLHNAMADAVATAELLLAQASYLEKGQGLRLSELFLRCAG